MIYILGAIGGLIAIGIVLGILAMFGVFLLLLIAIGMIVGGAVMGGTGGYVLIGFGSLFILFFILAGMNAKKK